MSKKCAKCEKTVYPTEELKCLDKVWHKACFRCWECNMILGMKNYKGYDKKPYCNAHYPKTSFTAVAETPEMARLAQNTKLQSQIAYHDQFEKAKGKYTFVTDDPETRRALKNQTTVSSIKYHEDFEKNIKGQKIQVADDPESRRHKQNTALTSQVEYKGLRDKQARMEAVRGQEQGSAQGRGAGARLSGGDDAPSPYSGRNHSTQIYNSATGGPAEPQGRKKVGSIADYDPMNEQYGSIAQGYHPVGSSRQSAQWEESAPAPQAPPSGSSAHHSAPQTHQGYGDSPTANGGHMAPPVGGVPSGIPRGPLVPLGRSTALQMRHPGQREPEPVAPAPPPSQPYYHPPPPEPQPPVHAPPPPAPSASPQYRAMYDYEAGDEDEVSFRDGDIIINPEPIDDGWMYGTVQRTGRTGMLPANYVDLIR